MSEKIFYSIEALAEYLHSMPEDQSVTITVDIEAEEAADGEESSEGTE